MRATNGPLICPQRFPLVTSCACKFCDMERSKERGKRRMASNGHEATMDSTMDGLIRRSLNTANAAAQNCPDPEIVAAYYERSLDPKERARFETHLSSCARCREQLAVMVRADEKPSPAVRHTWLWDWRWLAPAAAALLILTVWGVHRSTSPERVANGKQPLVAMSRPPQLPEPNGLPHQPTAESSTSAQALVAPKSTDRITSQLQTQEQAKAPQMDQLANSSGRETIFWRECATFAGQQRTQVAQKSSDESNGVSELKKEGRQRRSGTLGWFTFRCSSTEAADRPSGTE